MIIAHNFYVIKGHNSNKVFWLSRNDMHKDIQLPMLSVHITTNLVNFNPVHVEVSSIPGYTIMWNSLSVTCGMSVFPYIMHNVLCK
jgi:hypothetical protein